MELVYCHNLILEARIMDDLRAAFQLHLTIKVESVQWKPDRSGYRVTFGGSPINLDGKKT